jgi:hypothetical protein
MARIFLSGCQITIFFRLWVDLGSTKNPKKSGTWIFHIFRFSRIHCSPGFRE